MYTLIHWCYRWLLPLYSRVMTKVSIKTWIFAMAWHSRRNFIRQIWYWPEDGFRYIYSACIDKVMTNNLNFQLALHSTENFKTAAQWMRGKLFGFRLLGLWVQIQAGAAISHYCLVHAPWPSLAHHYHCHDYMCRQNQIFHFNERFHFNLINASLGWLKLALQSYKPQHVQVRY